MGAATHSALCAQQLITHNWKSFHGSPVEMVVYEIMHVVLAILKKVLIKY